MIIFSDLHLKPESESIVLGEVLPGIRQASRDSGDRDVAFLGDFWHLRYVVDVRLQNAVRDELLRWDRANIRLSVIPGNHDQVDLEGRNALEVFDSLPNVQVFTVPTWTKWGLWVPYRAKASDIQEAIQRKCPNGENWPQVLFIHHGIRGAMMNNRMADTEGLPAEMFQGFQTIICGHYHKRQTIGSNLYYVGSPWQTTAGEIGQPKGYATWDGRTLRWVDTQWGPRHYEFIVESPDQPLDLSMVRPQDKVKVEVRHAGVDTEAVAKQLAVVGVMPVIDYAIEHNHVLRLGAAGSIEEYAARYVESFAGEQQLDPGRLLEVFKGLVG